MNQSTHSQRGSAALVAIAVLAVVLIAGAGYFVWQKNKDKPSQKSDNTTQPQASQKDEEQGEQNDETRTWQSVTTKGGRLSMKVPNGWTMTAYPGDFLGSFDVGYDANTPAVINTNNDEYMGHSLRFLASIADVGDAGLGPQWSSPQPGLKEMAQDYSIGTLNGKRYKAVFTGDLQQTIYQYVFDLESGKKLNIVYTINRDQGEKDAVEIVEKAIATIQLN